MITSVTLLILSLFALYIGAGWLVKGSSELALKAKISNLVIGLTIVAFGTSAPELVVSLNATLSGQGDISVGNIIGSNIFNIAAILGISAVIQPLQAKRQLTRLDIPILIVATVVFTLLFWNGTLGRLEGCLFLAGIILYTIFSLYYSRKHEKKVEELAGELEKQPEAWYKDVMYIVGGLVILIFASNLLVNNAVSIAQELGVSEAVIGLTIVAAGTSLPELATSVVSALKKNPDIAIGNIVGSNLFNILAIAGTSSMVKPIVAKNVNYVDLLVMLGLTLLLLPLVKSGQKISRAEGWALIVVYLCYLAWLLRDLI
ncbi:MULTISPECIES: calcium/sodium antiporter [Parabacteroides]|uniref:calcium/sodium antiporter n=1 Tax=Parabacteroides TaxID=375288 RepID=UPI000F00E795|nr:MULTISPECIES: calcium/sodium antiporter [Parabacteroides]RHU28838.1 sodium:calcium antiporter [Parabacteroides sp. TM07-1AC]WFE83034.1 calcium/sodium antiporter [Parabacteroides chongii]